MATSREQQSRRLAEIQARHAQVQAGLWKGASPVRRLLPVHRGREYMAKERAKAKERGTRVDWYEAVPRLRLTDPQAADWVQRRVEQLRRAQEKPKRKAAQAELRKTERYKQTHAATQKRRRRRDAEESPPKRCVVCGKAFRPPFRSVGGGRKITCSDDCTRRRLNEVKLAWQKKRREARSAATPPGPSR